jgi:hypothetical protein
MKGQLILEPLGMHQKLTKHGRFCKKNNQLPTNSHVELKDNSIGPNEWQQVCNRSNPEKKTVEVVKGRILAG